MYREHDTSTPKPGLTHLPSTVATVFTMSTDPKLVAFPSAPLVMGTQDMAISIVIAVLCLIAAIIGVYVRRKMKKRVTNHDHSMALAIADLQENSIDNPMYGGK